MKPQRIATLLVCSLGVAMMAMSQPAAPRGERPGPEARNDQAQGDRQGERPNSEPPRGRLGLELKIDPDALRVRLERSIARNEELLERNRAALVKLNAGAPASEVLNELRPSPGERVPRTQARNERGPERAENQAGELKNRDEIIKFLQAEFPKLWHNLKPLIEANPRSADRLLRNMAPPIQEILYLDQSHPVLAKLKTEQMRVGLDFVEATNVYGILLRDPNSSAADFQSAKDGLLELATERFEVELKTKQYEINRLESRLSDLKASVEQVEERRDQEISQMVAGAVRNAERQNRQQRRNGPGSDQAGSGDD